MCVWWGVDVSSRCFCALDVADSKVQVALRGASDIQNLGITPACVLESSSPNTLEFRCVTFMIILVSIEPTSMGETQSSQIN